MISEETLARNCVLQKTHGDEVHIDALFEKNTTTFIYPCINLEPLTNSPSLYIVLFLSSKGKKRKKIRIL